ncbi:hypothetical protein [Streptomyces sp. NPDC002580]|uniref:hypothetical protein n=1 Tax=Streptomyces sp. NPDC002580 TaxID=3364653 RepID=UPI0036A30D26
MTQRSSTGGFKRRLSPHPSHTPRTAWVRFNRPRTDSGWPLLMLNFLVSALFTAFFVESALSTRLISAVLWWLGVGSFLELLWTGYVMTCVARGQTGQLAPEAPPQAPTPPPGSGGYRGRHT